MLVNYGASEVITYTREDSTTYSRALLEGTPKIIFRTENEPLQIRFKFMCPYEHCFCSKTLKERQESRLKGAKVVGCPFRRHVKFLDSCLIVPSSLSQMVDDLHKARAKGDSPLQAMFPCTYRFAQSQNMSFSQFFALTDAKMTMPYEYIDDFAKLRETVSVPNAEHFASHLRGTAKLDEEGMANFRKNWDILGIRSMLHMYQIYNSCDVTLLADTVTFYLNELFRITGLWGSHFITLSAQALTSVLLNCKDPHRPYRTIFLEFLEQEVYEKMDQSLIGGYSVNSAFFVEMNMGHLDGDRHSFDSFDVSDDDFLFIRSGNLLDFNSLYPG